MMVEGQNATLSKEKDTHNMKDEELRDLLSGRDL